MPNKTTSNLGPTFVFSFLQMMQLNYPQLPTCYRRGGSSPTIRITKISPFSAMCFDLCSTVYKHMYCMGSTASNLHDDLTLSLVDNMNGYWLNYDPQLIREEQTEMDKGHFIDSTHMKHTLIWALKSLFKSSPHHWRRSSDIEEDHSLVEKLKTW